MKIRTKITSLVTALIGLVVISIVVNLIWMEQRKVRVESEARIQALMEGVLRISRESLSGHDELMLLSYLKFLMKDYPEIEVVMVSRQDHSSLLGEVRSELFYRTLTVTERAAATFKATAIPAAVKDPNALPPDNAPVQVEKKSIPPETLTIQIGFSKTVLDRQIREAQMALAAAILRIAGVGLLLGIIGSLWVGRLLARPVTFLAEAARNLGEGQFDTTVETRGNDEISELSRQFNLMTSKLRELIGFKEDLMSTLTHELNNPLGGLKGFLVYLQGSEKTQDLADRRDAYATMLEAVNQMELSLSNALQLFRTGARPMLALERLAVNDILNEAVLLFTPMAQAQDISLKNTSSGEPVYMLGDKELIRRVCINLISNALKYSQPGGVVSVSLQENETQVILSVSDTGVGISPADQERIFTKFYRAPGLDGRPQRIPGSGLGLAIAKQAVEQHQGKIWVQSEVGKGSTFSVAVPKNQQGRANEN